MKTGAAVISTLLVVMIVTTLVLPGRPTATAIRMGAELFTNSIKRTLGM